MYANYNTMRTKPGKKWDLGILRNICLSNKIEEHFEFFTRTERENYKESFLVICQFEIEKCSSYPVNRI